MFLGNTIRSKAPWRFRQSALGRDQPVTEVVRKSVLVWFFQSATSVSREVTHLTPNHKLPMSPVSNIATLLALTVSYSLTSVSVGTFLSVNGQTVEVQEQQQQRGAQEMLENATLIAPFGWGGATAELQSQAARTQDTLVDAMENAEVAEIKRAVLPERH